MNSDSLVLAFFVAILGTLFMSVTLSMMYKSHYSKIRHFPKDIFVVAGVLIFYCPLLVSLFFRWLFTSATESVLPIILIFEGWSFLYVAAYVRPYFQLFHRTDHILAKEVVVLTPSQFSIQIMDFIFGRHSIFKNSPTGNLLERSFVLFSHICLTSIAAIFMLIFSWNNTFPQYKINEMTIVASIATSESDQESAQGNVRSTISSGAKSQPDRRPAKENSQRCSNEKTSPPLSIILAAFSFFGILLVYCYREVSQDYTSKWKTAANELLKGDYTGDRLWLLAIAILNMDLWTKKLFALFFTSTLLKAYRKSKNNKIKEKIGSTEQEFVNRIKNRKLTEKHAYDLLRSCLKNH